MLRCMDAITRQDLLYAAAALRQAARAAEKQATDPGFTSIKTVFERAAKEQDELAAKFDRIATTMASKALSTLR